MKSDSLHMSSSWLQSSIAISAMRPSQSELVLGGSTLECPHELSTVLSAARRQRMLLLDRVHNLNHPQEHRPHSLSSNHDNFPLPPQSDLLAATLLAMSSAGNSQRSPESHATLLQLQIQKRIADLQFASHCYQFTQPTSSSLQTQWQQTDLAFLTAASRSPIKNDARCQANKICPVSLGHTFGEHSVTSAEASLTTTHGKKNTTTRTVSPTLEELAIAEHFGRKVDTNTKAQETNQRKSATKLSRYFTKRKDESGADAIILEAQGWSKDDDRKKVIALETLGTSCLQRRMDKSPYIDASVFQDPPPMMIAAGRRSRGGIPEPFPEKLYRIIQEAEKDGNEDIISFFPHGRAIGIHKPEQFAKEIMPKYFKHTRLSSFQRQLGLYGFGRINSGCDAGGYYHELFLRGRPALSAYISRAGAPNAGAAPRKRGVKAHNSVIDPDFYGMAQIRGVVLVAKDVS